MIGLDTNVLVRYLAQDDAKQSPHATSLINSLTNDDPGFIPLIALVELVWVMQGCYGSTKPEVVAILQTLLRTSELIIENTDIAFKALDMFLASKADFSDCLIALSANKAGCECVFTFDKNAAKTAGMRLVV
ncbi:PIN domain-containing protein [Glaciimonas sp. GG7]